MNITCSGLKTERQWRAAIGMNEKRFNQLLGVFETCYLSYYGNSLNSQLIKNARTTVSIMKKTFCFLPSLVLSQD